jgi:hypothetical protein
MAVYGRMLKLVAILLMSEMAEELTLMAISINVSNWHKG